MKDFGQLTTQISFVHDYLQKRGVGAVNVYLTIRNWLIGYHIVEYEQNGSDRAKYGANLLKQLAQNINIRGLGETNLKIIRQFYLIYPQIKTVLIDNNKFVLPEKITEILNSRSSSQIRQLPTDELYITEYENNNKSQSATDLLENDDLDDDENYILKILSNISFTHFVELIKIDNRIKRRFYELIILNTTPSVKELKRNINTLSFERFGLSENKELAIQQVYNKIIPAGVDDIVKSHYFFDFLNLKQTHLIEESELEQALINHLQEFMIELGNGFCFEARQKRILIGNEYFFIDLVFYHRVLKCHIIVELKTDKARHENIGQLKTYIQYFKRHIQLPEDNPPIGILLVTDQNKALVEFAVAESDKEIFVSKYLPELPDKALLAEILESELKKLL
ncbi:MAG: PDDEXK nuclease domain-containing protein [Bacteroidales bacterium]|nr:PDDEXK nuclease domain-containing protein [Bacteroidales bacterium]